MSRGPKKIRDLPAASGPTASYVYNAEGERVRKTVGGVSVDYLYDLGGHQIAELNTSGGWNRSEVYVGGRHVATYSGGPSGSTYFIHADWLGTERARSGVSGSVCETVMSLPFGDAQVTSGSCGDPSPLHFTGKQRDTETGNDDFGARYYNSGMARWVTPDWSAREEAVPYADLTNPQTLNLYAYVGNNPTTRTDADGHFFSEALMGTLVSGEPVVVAAEALPAITAEQENAAAKQEENTNTEANQEKNTDPPQQQSQNLTQQQGQQNQSGASGQGQTPTISANPNWLDSRQAACVGEGVKSAGKDLIMYNEVKAVVDAAATGSPKPLKELLSGGTAVAAGKKGAEDLARSRPAQKAIKAALRAEGFKASANAVGRTAGRFAKGLAVVGFLISANTGYEAYKACMSY